MILQPALPPFERSSEADGRKARDFSGPLREQIRMNFPASSVVPTRTIRIHRRTGGENALSSQYGHRVINKIDIEFLGPFRVIYSAPDTIIWDENGLHNTLSVDQATLASNNVDVEGGTNQTN